MSTDSDDTFRELIDLAAEELGGRAVACSDDFFASMHNLVKPGRGVFLPDEYTDRGKWMDGWESGRTRRSSALPDRDWCVVRLGARGLVRALDIDTNHFLGNHPPHASVEITDAPWDADAAALAGADWRPLLAPSALGAGCRNLFVLQAPASGNHVRLTIYPDGGVARLRVHGQVDPASDHPREIDDDTAARLRPGERELAGAREGGRAIACSDMFFSPMNNLLLPGRAAGMSDGWESRRRRGPGHDWIIVRLARPGTVGLLEIDTNHFKGNAPDACSVAAVHAPEASILDLTGDRLPWAELLPRSPLTPHRRHWFRTELVDPGPVTHLRLEIDPDGGVSRLRAWGRSEP